MAGAGSYDSHGKSQVLLEGEEQEEQGAEQDGLDGLQGAVHLPPSRELEVEGEGGSLQLSSDVLKYIWANIR